MDKEHPHNEGPQIKVEDLENFKRSSFKRSSGVIMSEVEIKPKYNLTQPDDIVNFSKVLNVFITQSKLSTKIRGDEYVNVDGWKFAGLNFGLVPLVTEPTAQHESGKSIMILYHEIEKRFQNQKKKVVEPFFASTNEALYLDYKDRYKDKIVKSVITDYFNYRCGCDIINTSNNMKVGSGFGLCSNLEMAKSSFDEFAVYSMAQTRSIGRGFKNVIGFIMKASGYSETPKEEMDGQSKTVIIDEGTLIDIEAALEGLTTIDEVVKLWGETSANLMSQNRIKNMFSKRKAQIKSKK